MEHLSVMSTLRLLPIREVIIHTPNSTNARGSRWFDLLGDSFPNVKFHRLIYIAPGLSEGAIALEMAQLWRFALAKFGGIFTSHRHFHIRTCFTLYMQQSTRNPQIMLLYLLFVHKSNLTGRRWLSNFQRRFRGCHGLELHVCKCTLV